MVARGRAISVIPENWVLFEVASLCEERARTKVAAANRWPEFVKKKGGKKKKKEMRGRTRELCREANDSQNWFADNANGKGRNPRIVLRVREYSAFAKENFA